MGYDIQRAALVTCCLSALLLAASLMPAAGLGSLPSVGDSGSGDAAPQPDVLDPSTADESTPPESTPVETTPEQTPAESEDPTPGETDEPETTVQTTTETPDDDENSWALGIGSLVFAMAFGVLALLGGGVTYTGGLLVLESVFGYESISWLPFSGKVRSVPQLTMSSLIGTAAATGSFMRQLRSALSVVGAGAAALATIPAEFGKVIGMAVAGPIRALSGISLSLGGGFGSLFAAASNFSLGLGRSGDRAAAATTEDARESADVAPDTESDSPPPLPTSVTEAFDRMTDRLRPRNQDAMTPAELAEYAVDRGWPATPVETVTETFRQIRYGGYEETSEETEQAVSAFERLRDFWRRSE